MSLPQDQHSIEQMSTGDHSIIPRPEGKDLAQYDVGLSLVDQAAKALTYYSQQHTTLDITAIYAVAGFASGAQRYQNRRDEWAQAVEKDEFTRSLEALEKYRRRYQYIQGVSGLRRVGNACRVIDVRQSYGSIYPGRQMGRIQSRNCCAVAVRQLPFRKGSVHREMAPDGVVDNKTHLISGPAVKQAFRIKAKLVVLTSPI